MDSHSEPTYANQLWHARKMLTEKGRDALNNPHAMIGRSCRCGSCFCCAAAEVLSEPRIAICEHQDDNSVYDLWVDGRVLIVGESFTVCDQVRASLVAGEFDDSEVGEVARRIANAVKGS